MTDAQATVSQLWVYPVKSCAGVMVQEATLTDTGLLHDRCWMVVDAHGEMVSQRDVQPEDEDDEIAAFQRRKNKNFNQKKNPPYTAPTNTGHKGYSSNYKSNAGPGNNTNRNGKYCFYCKLQNHTQDECFKRIREKKPCRDRQGRAYWPRVYLTENSDSQNQGQQQGFH